MGRVVLSAVTHRKQIPDFKNLDRDDFQKSETYHLLYKSLHNMTFKILPSNSGYLEYRSLTKQKMDCKPEQLEWWFQHNPTKIVSSKQFHFCPYEQYVTFMVYSKKGKYSDKRIKGTDQNSFKNA